MIVGTINVGDDPAQAALINALLKRGDRPVVVSLRTPYDLASFPAVETYLCAYSIRPVSMEAVAKALESDDRLCFLTAQRDPSADDPTPAQFYRAGTIGMIMRMRKLSEGGLKVLVQGLCRARIQRFVSESPCYRVRLERTDDRVLSRSVGVEALLRSVRQNIDKLSGLGKTIQPELSMVVQSVEDPGRMRIRAGWQSRRDERTRRVELLADRRGAHGRARARRHHLRGGQAP